MMVPPGRGEQLPMATAWAADQENPAGDDLQRDQPEHAGNVPFGLEGVTGRF
jgi:hypothetical protein